MYIYIYIYRHECTNCTVQLIKCCSWWWINDSPKHVEPFNEKIKTIHKNLCISLVYIHTFNASLHSPISHTTYRKCFWPFLQRQQQHITWRLCLAQLTAEPRVRSQVSPCGVYGEKKKDTFLSEHLDFALSVYSTSAPYSHLNHLLLTVHNLSNWQRR